MAKDKKTTYTAPKTKTPMEIERAKKAQKKIYIIVGSVSYLLAIITFFHYSAIRATDKRANFFDVLNRALGNVFMRPLAMFPLHLKGFGTFFGLSLMCFALLAMYIAVQKLKKHDNPDTVNGDAHFMNEQEWIEYNKQFAAPLGTATNDGPENMIMSKDIRLAIDNRGTRRNMNIIVIGGSGTGKSRFFAGPNILQANANYVITDPSGELLNDYGKFLENRGYEVMTFNLTSPYLSNHYNPFTYISEEKDIFTIVEAFVKNVKGDGKSGGDPFWDDSEKLLLTAIMLYLWHMCPPEKQTFSEVAKYVSLAQINEENGATDITQTELGLLFEDLENRDPENLAVQQWKKFILGGDKTLKSILISVGVHLRSFELSNIKYLTNTDDLDLYSFGDTKKAIFVITPTADTTFGFLIAMFYHQIFSTLYNYCEVDAKYGYRITDGKDTIKIFHATQDTTDLAKRRAVNYISDIKKGVKVVQDKEKKLYKVYSRRTLDPTEKMYLNKEYYTLSQGKSIYENEHTVYLFSKESSAKSYLNNYIPADQSDKKKVEVANTSIILDEKFVRSCYDSNVMKICVKGDNDDTFVDIETGNLHGWRGTKPLVKEFVDSLKGYSVQPGRKRCEYHIRFIMDEFANIGQIPDFSQKLATMRKYEISCSIILQAKAQLKKIYEKDFEDIIGNCDSCIFLGSVDSDTIKFVVEKLGKRTTTVASTSWQSGNKGGSESFNKSSIELMTGDKISLMDNEKCLVFIRGVRPYYGDKYDLLDHPNFKESSETAGTFFIKRNNINIDSDIPLRLRKKKAEEKVEAQKNIESVSTPKPAPVNIESNDNEKISSNIPAEIDEVKNQARIEEAKAAKEALDNFNEDVESSESFSIDLANMLNVTPTSSKQDIKESIETMIKLEYMDDDTEMTFDKAN